MKKLFLLIILIFITGCGDSIKPKDNPYQIHNDITVTIFWVGEEASKDNGKITNIVSAWDVNWVSNFGGVDDPYNRSLEFKPKENPFYFALPYNDLDKDNYGAKKTDISYIPWADENSNKGSICKNRWIKIIKEDKIAYAQWEDVGPFGEDDKEYVFGDKRPKNSINDHAGLDVSPAVRDFLKLEDIDKVNWQFVDDIDVPDGPWMEIITTSDVNWD